MYFEAFDFLILSFFRTTSETLRCGKAILGIVNTVRFSVLGKMSYFRPTMMNRMRHTESWSTIVFSVPPMHHVLR